MKFQGKISYRPSSATDAIPYLAVLYVDGDHTDCRWRGSYAQAHEALTEMQRLYLERGEGEMIDLPEISPDNEPRRSVA